MVGDGHGLVVEQPGSWVPMLFLQSELVELQGAVHSWQLGIGEAR